MFRVWETLGGAVTTCTFVRCSLMLMLGLLIPSVACKIDAFSLGIEGLHHNPITYTSTSHCLSLLSLILFDEYQNHAPTKP